MASLRHSAGLLTGLMIGSKALSGPVSIAVDLTRRCNLHCLGCIHHSPLLKTEPHPEPTTVSDLPLDLFTRLCQQAGRLGCRTLILIGEGEPLLHPHILAMIRTAKAEKLQVKLVSNGTLLTGDLVRELVEIGLDQIQMSLWATTAEQAEKVYPKTGAATFAAQMKGLDLLVSSRTSAGKSYPEICLHQPLSKHSAIEIGHLIKLAREHAADEVSFSPLRDITGALTDHAPGREQIEELIKLRQELRGDPLARGMDPFLNRWQIGEAVWNKTPCFIAWYHLRVDINGNVFPCKSCNVPLGNLHQASLKKIWNDTPIRQFRQQARNRGTMTALLDRCDCCYCCHAISNRRIQGVLRWVDPRTWR